MNVDVFVKQIKMNKDRETYIQQRIIKDYIPYEEKIARCEQIINVSSYIDVGDHKIYRINTPIRFLLTALTIINEYTDIDISFDDDQFVKEYNLLDANGLIDELLKAIPKHEHETWMMLLTMIDDDKHENERSLIAYFDTKIEAITNILTTSLEAIANTEATSDNNE